MMIEAILIVAGGILGSGHCIGMCGGFALTLGSSARGGFDNFVRQLVYAGGRVSVYVLAGAAVGFGSGQFGAIGPHLVYIQSVLAFAAGAFLIAEGLISAGLVRRPFASSTGCPGANVFATLLRAPNLSSVFVGGFINGVLPCGLVYGYLALAASTGNMFLGAAVMALFGLGTLPALVFTGLSGSLISHFWRKRVFQLAALCMILTGVISLWRGVAAAQSAYQNGPTCPACSEYLQ